MYRAYYKSEVGLLEVTANEKGITSILFVEEQGEENPNVVVEQCIAELDEYFNQKRTVFSVPLSAEGTAFQKKVWEALYTIPYGTSASYLDIAKKNWEPKSCASNRWSE
ncbi:Methylated-DNA--protein-cysteine methyltransferase [Bacillus cytotoxicus]|uniref:Methylated-DNA--protein-cysteine methyltransferase n=1 Tax=Bacillus cytotoxicus TaxID=580165 RepID=A0AAX2CFS0_9BACI|nr:Methylated-DNA--protein-cysteine methyltransferase [Bacillus cytotoxicus]